jgi:hypothetical protein
MTTPIPAQFGEGNTWLGQGFGLALRGSYPVHGLATRDASAQAIPTALLLEDDARAPISLAAGERLREMRYPDGRLGMAIEDHRELGYRIFAEDFGDHRISADGKTVHSRPTAGLPRWRWQRLLIAQVLPLVAALRGFEVLHASAIALGGRAFALAGDSGAGKSTLAAQMALAGNQLLAEDVLAVSLGADGRPQAHPGSTALSLRPEQASLASRLTRAGLAEQIGSDEKQHILLDAAKGSLPLSAVYHLRRDSSDCGRPIGAARSASISDLMSCSYVKYLRTSARLTAQLEVQAAIARAVPIVPVAIAGDLAPELLAAELEAHMASIGGPKSR